MKPVLAVITAAIVAFGPTARPAIARPAEGAVTSLSVVSASGRAEVIVGVAGGTEVRDFVLRSPDRIVIDLAGVSLGLTASGYDRVARGGITDVKYSQYRKNTVRVVLYLDSPHAYTVSRTEGEVHVAVTTDAAAQFAAWYSSGRPADAETRTASRSEVPPSGPTRPAPKAVDRPTVSEQPAENKSLLNAADATAPDRRTRTAYVDRATVVPQQRSQQPRISVTYQGSDIRDVLAAFSAFSGRTILPSSSVGVVRIDAEIRDQPWDVALQAILSAQGLAATEDANGIIIVDTQERIAARTQSEPLGTRIIRLNYQRATAVANQIRQRLLQCIPSERGGGTGSPTPAGQPPASGAAAPSIASQSSAGTDAGTCRGRGSVSADEVTNSVSVTAPVSSVEDLIAFAETLDMRQPQVNIKAKIVLVNRTDLDALGIKYDLGTSRQFFNQVVQRVDSNGSVVGTLGPTVNLGGNTVSAIANASGSVPGAALRLIYSTALGKFDFTTFLDALQEVSLLDVQSEPSVTTLNNRTAELISGSQVPFVPLVSSGGTGTSLTGPITVERVQTGVTLRVTPSVTNNRQIMLQVEVTNSDVNFTNNGTLIDNNNTKNELLVADGQTIVIGGLTQTSVRVTKSGIPLLVDLPLIGRLFGYTTRQEQRRDLLVLITPHIIDEGQSPSEAARR
jgi:type IV pilus assembly protein PilQ